MSKSNCNCTIWVKQEDKGFYILGTTVSDPDNKETIFEMNESEFASPDFKETIENINNKAIENGCCIDKFFVVDPGTDEDDKAEIIMAFNNEKPALH